MWENSVRADGKLEENRTPFFGREKKIKILRKGQRVLGRKVTKKKTKIYGLWIRTREMAVLDGCCWQWCLQQEVNLFVQDEAGCEVEAKSY